MGQNRQLTLGSLFSGSGGFELAGLLSGIRPVWNSEVETFAIRVTTRRLPQVKHYGDITTLDGAKLPPVDIVTWGSPCQDLSSAGKRAGLAGQRSGLYVQAVRIVGEMLEATNREYPKWCVFENVPGLLSSNKGADFTACLDMMQDLGFISDVNILDAQDMGVPQRRKRVYIAWINADYLLTRRTALSESITLQLLTEILLNNLAGLLKAYNTGQPKLDVKGLKYADDGLRRRINLFSLQKAGRLEMLQRFLDGTQAMCRNTQGCGSDSIHGGIPMKRPGWTKEATGSSGHAETEGYTSIGLLLRESLEEGSDLQKESIISTWTRETTIRKIFMCFRALLNTLDVTSCLIHLLRKEPMSVNCFEWAKYTLTELEEFINAAEKYSKRTENMEWDEFLRNNKPGFQACKDNLVADFADGRAGKILFESEGVSGYSAEGFRSWQRAASGTEAGIGAAVIGIDGYNGAVSDKAATLGQNCGISTGRNGVMVLNDQGGDRMDVTEDVTCTLRAEAHHPPCVMGAAGFCTEHSAKSRTIGYGEETSPTLRAGVVPAAVALENHPANSRLKVSDNGVVQTITERCGTGGGNVPMVMECVPVAYGICSKHSHSMLSDNPKSGFYEAQTSRTLDTSNQCPAKNQGGIAVIEKPAAYTTGKSGCRREDVSCTIDSTGGRPTHNQVGMAVLEGNGSRPSHKGDGYKETDIMYTLNCVEQHGVAYGIDRAAFNQGANAQYGFSVDEERQPTITARGPGAVATYSTSKSSFFTNAEKELANTLVATDYKDPPCVNDMTDTDYIVRRLTPTECARLQGFPDWWCAGLETENPTDDELAFWRRVFDTHARINGVKPRSDAQIKKWLKDPHSDSAEYRLWGNGICLSNAVFVLSGIVYYALSSTENLV